MTTKTCPQCGKDFEGRANKLYCSLNCKMMAFYSSATGSKNGLTDNNAKSVNHDDEVLTDNHDKSETGMVTIPVPFTVSEKEMLECQSEECETGLPNLIRIRCLMDETDIRFMKQTIAEQKQLIEELRIKLGFYQHQGEIPVSVKPLTEKSVDGLLISMNEAQLEFLTDKYLESLDFESDHSEELLPDGTHIHNERKSLEYYEDQNPGHILTSMGQGMVIALLSRIEARLIDECGYSKEEFEDNPLIDEFDNLEND
jgi:endogenous inhibitor of DNA gyrase (YacG/DUF329 family)